MDAQLTLRSVSERVVRRAYLLVRTGECDYCCEADGETYALLDRGGRVPRLRCVCNVCELRLRDEDRVVWSV